jgi:hypothetical protein
MKRKKTALDSTKKERRVGPSAVGRMAHISKQAASRKLLQGKTPEEIVVEAQIRRERLARIRGVNGAGGVNQQAMAVPIGSTVAPVPLESPGMPVLAPTPMLPAPNWLRRLHANS